MAEKQTPSFFQGFREDNPDYAYWQDVDILHDALGAVDEGRVQEFREKYDDFRSLHDDYQRKRRPGKLEELGRGLGRGIDTTQALGYGLVGMAGDATGIDSLRDFGAKGYSRNIKEAGKNAPSVRFSEIGDNADGLWETLGDVTQWAAGGIGELAPTMAVTAGSALASGGTAAAAGLAGKGFIREWAKKRVAKEMGEEAFEALLKEGGKETLERALKKQVVTLASQGGALLSGSGLGAGEVYGNFIDVESGKVNLGSSDRGDRVAAAVGGGLIIGALDAVLPASIIGKISKRMGIPANKVVPDIAEESMKNPQLVGRMTKFMLSTASDAGKEGTTEALQELVSAYLGAEVDDLVDFNWDEFQVEALEAFALGALGGGVMGGGPNLVEAVSPVGQLRDRGDQDALDAVNERLAEEQEQQRPTEDQARSSSRTVAELSQARDIEEANELIAMVQEGKDVPDARLDRFRGLVDQYPDVRERFEAVLLQRRKEEDAKDFADLSAKLTQAPDKFTEEEAVRLNDIIRLQPELLQQVEGARTELVGKLGEAKDEAVAQLTMLTGEYDATPTPPPTDAQQVEGAPAPDGPGQTEFTFLDRKGLNKQPWAELVETAKQRGLIPEGAKTRTGSPKKADLIDALVEDKAIEGLPTAKPVEAPAPEPAPTVEEEPVAEVEQEPEAPAPTVEEEPVAEVEQEPEAPAFTPREYQVTLDDGSEQSVTEVEENVFQIGPRTKVSYAELEAAAGEYDAHMTMKEWSRRAFGTTGTTQPQKMQLKLAEQLGLVDTQNTLTYGVPEGEALPEISKTEDVRGPDVFNKVEKQGGLRFSKSKGTGGNASRSNWYAVVLDKETGNVHMRQVVKKKSGYQILFMGDSKTAAEAGYAADGAYALPASKAKGNLIVKELVHLDVAPNNDPSQTWNFGSVSDYEAAYKDAPSSAARGNTAAEKKTVSFDQASQFGEQQEIVEAAQEDGTAEVGEAGEIIDPQDIEDGTDAPQAEGLDAIADNAFGALNVNFDDNLAGFIAEGTINRDNRNEQQYARIWLDAPGFHSLLKKNILNGLDNIVAYEKTVETFFNGYEQRGASGGNAQVQDTPSTSQDSRDGGDRTAGGGVSANNRTGAGVSGALNSAENTQGGDQRKPGDRPEPQRQRVASEPDREPQGYLQQVAGSLTEVKVEENETGHEKPYHVDFVEGVRLPSDVRQGVIDLVGEFKGSYVAPRNGRPGNFRFRTREQAQAFLDSVYGAEYARNRKYMEAVKAGDMETAQQLVEEAAVAAGYVTKAFHGTPDGGFTVFEDTLHSRGGIFFTENEEYASRYADGITNTKRKDKRVYRVFLKTGDMGVFPGRDQRPALKRLREEGKDSARIEALQSISIYSDSFAGQGMFPPSLDGELDLARKLGGLPTTVHDADGNVYKVASGKRAAEAWSRFYTEKGFKNVKVAPDPTQSESSGLEIVVFSPKQIKSADPVTYDNSGNPIPLSERFNPETDDIRYSRASEGASNAKRSLTPSEQRIWDRTRSVLETAGIEVELVEQDVTSDNEFLNRQNASIDIAKRLVRVVMNDSQIPNATNLRALLHETAHAVVGGEAPAMIRALDGMALDLVDGKSNLDADHLKNPQEALVEFLAIKMEENGFGARSATLAERFFTTLKNFYLRTVMSIQNQLLGPDHISPSMALDYYENRMRMLLTSDSEQASSFIGTIGGPRLSMDVIADTMGKTVGSLRRVVIGRGGEVLYPETVPLTLGDVRYSIESLPTEKEEGQDFSKAESKARQLHAAYIELEATIQDLAKDAGATRAELAAALGAKQDPLAMAQEVAKVTPVATDITLDQLNEAERAQAVKFIRVVVSHYSSRASRKHDQAGVRSKKSQEAADNVAAEIAELKNDPANAALLAEHVRKNVRDMFTNVKKQVLKGSRLGQHYATMEAIGKEVSRSQDGVLQMAPEYERAFAKLSGNTDAPLTFAQALASLDIDWYEFSIAKVEREIANYDTNESFLALSANQRADARKALEEMNNNSALRAVMVAYAKGNSMHMDVLQARWDTAQGRYARLQETIEEVTTASDDHIEFLKDQMRDLQAEVANSSKRLVAQDRIKRKLLDYEAQHRRHQRALDRDKRLQEVIEKAAPSLKFEAEKWGREMGEIQEFDGKSGSIFMVMEPKRDGEVAQQLEFRVHDAREAFQAAFDDNQIWLELNEHAKNTPFYQKLESANRKLQYTLAVRDIDPSFNNLLTGALSMVDRRLATIGERFGAMAPAEGRRIKQMLAGWGVANKLLNARLRKPSAKWNKAYMDVIKVAGYAGKPDMFNRDVRTHVIHRLEGETGMSTDSGAVRLAQEIVEGLISNGSTPGKVDMQKLKPALAKWVKAEKEMGKTFDTLREDQGLPIEDRSIKTTDAFNKNIKRNQLRLKGIPQGWLTVPRSLDNGLMQLVYKRMVELNWFGTKGESLFGVGDSQKDAYWLDDTKTIEARMMQLATDFAPFLQDPTMRNDFFEPLLNNHDSMFSDVEASRVAEAWAESNGNMGVFILSLSDSSDLNPAEMADQVVKAFRNKGAFFRKVGGRADLKENDVNHANSARNFIVDSRSDIDLPSHFFEYAMFDQHSIAGYASRMAVNKYFGRNATELLDTVDTLGSRLKLMRSNAKHADDSKRVRKLTEMHSEVKKLYSTLDSFFNKSDTGPYVDDKVYNEFASLLVTGVLNNPKTAITQLITPMVDFTTAFKGVNGMTLGATWDAAKSFAKMGTGVFEAFGVHLDALPEQERMLAELLGGLNEAGLDLGEHIANPGSGAQFETKSGKIVKSTRVFQSALNRGVRIGKGSNERTPFSPQGIFTYVTTMANYATAVGTLRMFTKLSEQVAEYMDINGEWENTRLDITDKKVLNQLTKRKGIMGAFTGKDTIKVMDRQVRERFGMSFADFVRMQKQRKDNGEPVFNYNDVAAIGMIAEDEVSLNASLNSRPSWILNSPIKSAFLLWGWPLRKMYQMHKMARTEEGQYSAMLAGKAFVTLAMYVMPASLAYSMALDFYDEWMRGKAPNLRKFSTDKSVKENALASVERLARMGTYGMAGDMINSMINWTDYNSSQRGISLDSRVLVMSSYHNFHNGLRNWLQQGEASYATVGRPIMSALGGSGLIHWSQLWNNAMNNIGAEDTFLTGGILQMEDDFTKRSNVYNVIRAAAREAEVSLKAGGGFSAPNAMTMHVREMQFATLNNDRQRFMRHYREAVAAKQKLGDGFSYSEAVSAVKSSFQRRHPMTSLLYKTPTPAEEAAIYRKMPDHNKRDVRRAIMLHEHYSDLLGAGSRAVSIPSAL